MASAAEKRPPEARFPVEDAQFGDGENKFKNSVDSS